MLKEEFYRFYNDPKYANLQQKAIYEFDGPELNSNLESDMSDPLTVSDNTSRMRRINRTELGS